MEFIGFAAILILGCLVTKILMAALQEQLVVDAIAKHSPWLAVHSEILTMVCSFIMMLIVVTIPLFIKFRDNSTGINSMAKFGIAVSLSTGLTAAAYLIGLGFIAGQTLGVSLFS